MGFCLICWGGSRTGQRGKGAVSARGSGHSPLPPLPLFSSPERYIKQKFFGKEKNKITLHTYPNNAPSHHNILGSVKTRKRMGGGWGRGRPGSDVLVERPRKSTCPSYLMKRPLPMNLVNGSRLVPWQWNASLPQPPPIRFRPPSLPHPPYK